MALVPYTRPSITQTECDFVADAVANGWGDRCYDYIGRFEREFAEYVGTDYAVATSSCTGALTLCLASIDLKPRDEVIIADTNWVATAAPIIHLGATPVLVDILPDTWCLDPNEVRAAITSRTKAIIATHLYGNLANISALKVIAEEFGLILIEDAAEAIGSRWGDEHAGSRSHFGVFSFHGTKTLTTGEGGCLVTNDARLFERVQTLSNHGRSHTQVKQFWPDQIGYKFKMSNIQAALGCAQLGRIEELVSRKRQILEIYKKAFKNIDAISMNPEPAGTTNGAWMPTVVFDESSGVTREKLQTAFKSADIDARVFFWPLSSLPPFSSISARNAMSISARAINLPSFHDMTESQIELVTTVIFDVNDGKFNA
jgi:perosamine synthetase